MRHRVAGKKLNRTPAHRRALFRNLVTALLEHEAVRTTDAKAKELKRWGDR
jgi:large subunit ribosomal protein L17